MAAAQLKVRTYYTINLIQKLKELVNISNLCNFQLFASNIEENIIQSLKEKSQWVVHQGPQEPVKSKVPSIRFL